MADDPSQRLQLDEEQRTLLDALDLLPDEQKGLVLLHYFQGLTYREIGELTGANANTVKVKVHRARRALKKLLTGMLKEQVEGI